MNALLLALALFLLLNLLGALWRAAAGPTPADRLVALQACGTTIVAILLLLAQAGAGPAARHTALLLAALVLLAGLSFVHRLWPPPEEVSRHGDP